MKKILLVDDDEFYRNVARDYLQLKYEIKSAKSGQEALNFLAAGFIPDLILLDILMPEMDGWEAFNLIKGISLLSSVPIVFFTSVQDELEKNHASDLGAADYITKPFDEKSFVEKVDSIIEKHESACLA